MFQSAYVGFIFCGWYGKVENLRACYFSKQAIRHRK